MLRSRTVNKLRELASTGLSIRQISKRQGLSRNTVRKYLRSTPEPAKRPVRSSKLDPYKDQIEKWVEKDGLLDCTTMLQRMRSSGYTGGVTILRDYVHPMRPSILCVNTRMDTKKLEFQSITVKYLRNYILLIKLERFKKRLTGQ